MRLSILLLVLFSSLPVKFFSIEQDTICINNSKQTITNKQERYYFTTEKLTIENVIKKDFKPKEDVELTYVTGWVWVKLIIKNNCDKEKFLLNVSDGHVSGFYMYKPQYDGNYTITPPKMQHPEDGREIYNRLPSFYITIPKGETRTFYLLINTCNEVINFNYIIRDYTHFAQYVQSDYLIIGIYFGALLIIILVNLFYYVSLRDNIFFVYCLYIIGNFLLTVTLSGFGWLWISDPNVAYHFNFFCLRFWPDSLLFFTIQLVNLKQYRPRLSKISYLFLIYHSFIMPVLEYLDVFNNRTKFMAQWETVNWGLAIVLIFIVIISSYKNNRYIFKYYLIAYGILLIISAFPYIHYLNATNWLVFEHGMKAGTVAEMVILSFAISRRFRLTEIDLKNRKEEEQNLNNQIKQLEMNVRKAQMNPHFMFNALTSIEYFIMKNDSRQARDYLEKFADLMRVTLDNSRVNYIPLSDELKALNLYVELEFLRLKSYAHHFEIKINNGIDVEAVSVPALLIQPFVENAIWHGLQKKEAPGNIIIHLNFIDNELKCIIEDDGGGRVPKVNPVKRKSSGILITQERLKLIHAALHTRYQFEILDRIDENGAVTGTLVQFNLPYIIE